MVFGRISDVPTTLAREQTSKNQAVGAENEQEPLSRRLARGGRAQLLLVRLVRRGQNGSFGVSPLFRAISDTMGG